VRPILSSSLNESGHVDLVDFQSLPDGDFKFILHYKEHLTKFSFIRPLKCKKASEVAKELLNIFLTFGAPHVLQSNNGRKFTAGIITNLASLWPDLILVNGFPRYPQIQLSVERGNSTLKDSLVELMRDNKTVAWSYGIAFVQWGVNTTYHEAIKINPYEAVFGQKARMGLATEVPKQLLENIMTGTLEEDMLDKLLDPVTTTPKCQNDENIQVLNTELSNNSKIFYMYNIYSFFKLSY